MEGARAVVNLGSSTVTVPCVGFTPPVVGTSVQVEWRSGHPVVTGPARQLQPIGTITAPGTPRATVEIAGEEYLLYIRDGYTPELGDQVEVNPATGIIQGKITGVDEADQPDEATTGTQRLDVTVRATDSGRYETRWWGNDPWASNNNDGIWTFGNRIRDALKGATIEKVLTYLPLLEERGDCRIGTHPHGSIPAGAPSLGSLTPLPLGRRSGWIELPTAFGAYLAAGSRGIGVSAPGLGLNRWSGVGMNKKSGQIRFIGRR